MVLLKPLVTEMNVGEDLLIIEVENGLEVCTVENVLTFGVDG